jgi:hypothetical protein
MMTSGITYAMVYATVRLNERLCSRHTRKSYLGTISSCQIVSSVANQTNRSGFG